MYIVYVNEKNNLVSIKIKLLFRLRVTKCLKRENSFKIIQLKWIDLDWLNLTDKKLKYEILQKNKTYNILSENYTHTSEISCQRAI